MHILIIEDDAFVSLEISLILKEVGFSDIKIVDSEDDAIAAAKIRCPDLIVADFNLKQGDGISAIRGICSSKEIPHVYVTASAHHVRGIVPHARIVPKPFSALNIKRAVAELLPGS
jgi:CheY-like chemotaxis protein